MVVLAFNGFARGQDLTYQGDVEDVQVLRTVEQHPQAWRVWQPVIAQGVKKKHLLEAYGSMLDGNKDLGDVHGLAGKEMSSGQLKWSVVL